mgnify:CR=1 FL=1
MIYTDLENIDLSKLHGWWFTYNAYDEMWAAIRAEHKEDINNDYASPNVIRNTSFERLKEIILSL